MRYDPSRRGQNIIEYLLVVTAVVLVLITGILVKGGIFVKSTNSVLELPGQLLDIYKMNISASLNYANSSSTSTLPTGCPSTKTACCQTSGCIWVTSVDSSCHQGGSCQKLLPMTMTNPQCDDYSIPDCCCVKYVGNVPASCNTCYNSQ